MNTKNLIIAIVVVAVVSAGAYYFSQQYYAKPADNNKIVPKENNAVSIDNFSFNPETITVKAGTTVTWTNNDSASHTIKSAGFNSGNLSKGSTFKFKFESKGNFDYSCGIHPVMKGKVIVE